ncbi:MAG: polysaccharide deacetylase family protein [Planctomycetales bacterium]|nr:polysaccharide deacetylase family protein [Planctomycetales bacterium]
MKQLAIRSVTNFAAVLNAALGPVRTWRRDQAHILMYHRVVPMTPGVPAPTLNVTPRAFRQQVAGLLRRGYRITPLSKIVEASVNGESLPAKSLAITFDDGYENMYTRVFPVVKEFSAPITIFVCTKWLGTDAPMHFDEWGIRHRDQLAPECYRPLTWEQCREMSESGLVEIAAHTHSHNDFRDAPRELQLDMRECLQLLKSELQIECPNFAFPFGRMDEGFATAEMAELVRQSGVASALTTEPGPVELSTSPFLWGRNNVFPWDSAATIDARLAGWYQWLPRLRRRLRRVFGLAKHPVQSALSHEPTPDNQMQDAATNPNAIRDGVEL